MLVGKLTYDTLQKRKGPMGYLSHEKDFPSEYLSLKFNSQNERPLKNNLQDLSFKGLSLKRDNKPKKEDKMTPLLATVGILAAAGLALRMAPAYKRAGEYSVKEFFDFVKNKSGIDKTIVESLFEHVKDSKYAEKLVKVNGDKIIFHKKTIPQLIWDGLVYPFKILPADIANGVVGLLGKLEPLKGWSKRTLNKPVFRNIRQRSKVDAQVNSLRGLFEMSEKLKGKTDNDIASEMFRQSVKMFDSKTGNYDTKHERSLNRLVSGLPPAIFLANDAYNLSRMMDDDPKEASKEQKTRFKQEAARIGFNAYITLITLGALQKYINNSSWGIFLMTGATTLVTEAFSRLINGKHITRLTPDEAREENLRNEAPEANIKPDMSFKASDKKEEKHQKPLLSFDTLLKGSAFVIAAGFGVKGLRKIPEVEKQWKAFSGFFKKQYRQMTEISDYKISKNELNAITNTLEKYGFKDLALKYKSVAKNSANGEFINLGTKDKKVRPLVNFVIAPFKFAWNTVTLPFNLTMKVVNAFTRKPKGLSIAINDKKTLDTIISNYARDNRISDTESIVKFIENVKSGKVAKDANLTSIEKGLLNRISDVSSFAKSIENIGKEAKRKNLSQKQFQTYVKDNILKGFNVDSMSNVSNCELSNLAKTAATIATIWFLMTDNYNMVMLKSNGNDVDGAKTKFKERFVQEGSRLFYQTLLIDLFNSTFRSQYNRSLFGMSWITLTNTTMGEWLTRASVGVPIGVHSRDGLIALEQKQENATGLKKSYFNFMKRLTGKRNIKSYEVAPKNSPERIAQLKAIQNSKEINFTNRNIFNEMITNKI